MSFSVGPADLWAGGEHMCVWWGHKIITSHQSLFRCQLYGQRSGQCAEFLWVGGVETVRVRFSRAHSFPVVCFSQLVAARQDSVFLIQSEIISEPS